MEPAARFGPRRAQARLGHRLVSLGAGAAEASLRARR